MNIPILVAVLLFSVSRKAINQYRIKTGRLQLDFLDPMPPHRTLRQAYVAAESSWRRHMKVGRTLETLLFVVLFGAFAILSAVYGSPLGSLILTAALFVEVGTQWYQWVAVDLGLMARSWSWMIRETSRPRYLEG